MRDEDIYDYDFNQDFTELEQVNKYLKKYKKKKTNKKEFTRKKENERIAKILEILRTSKQNYNKDGQSELFTLLSFSYDATIKNPQNVKLENGKTALHFIYEYSLYDFAEEIKQLKIDPGILDDNGKLATDYCKCNDLKEFLEKK